LTYTGEGLTDMPETPKPSIKSIVLYGLAVLVVAFVGVLAGNWFVEWRRGQPLKISADNWAALNRTSLNGGDPFPSEELLDPDSNVVNIGAVLDGRKTVIVFLAPGCEPCAMAIDNWKKEAGKLPAGLAVMGIANGGPAEVREYRDKTEFPFPVYADPHYLYTQQYDISSFPTTVGLGGDGRVAFVMHGFDEDFSLTDANELIAQSEL
jgi:peroxiredoxin